MDSFQPNIYFVCISFDSFLKSSISQAYIIILRARERLKKSKMQSLKTESEKAAKEQELRKRTSVCLFDLKNFYMQFLFALVN